MATPCVAQDAVLDGYHRTVRDVFREAFDPDVRARVLVEPSFSPEFAVGLRRRGGHDVIFSLEPEKQLWGYSVVQLMKNGRITVLSETKENGLSDQVRKLEQSLPNDPRSIAIRRCERRIDGPLADLIADDWKNSLREEGRWQAELGVDGVSYEFSMDAGTGGMTRSIWSPPASSFPGLLVSLSEGMSTYCRTRTAEDLAKLRSSAELIASRIKEAQREGR